MYELRSAQRVTCIVTALVTCYYYSQTHIHDPWLC